MTTNGCQLIGWYDGPDDEGHARIWLASRDPDHSSPDALLTTLAEEIAHHVRNDLTHGACRPLVGYLKRSPRWRDAAKDRLIIEFRAGRL